MIFIRKWLIVTNLEGIPHDHIESGGVRRNRDPHAITQINLEAPNVVGSQDGQDLRVGVLAKTNCFRWWVPVHDLFECRVVIKSKNRIAVDISDEPAECTFIRDPQALSR